MVTRTRGQVIGIQVKRYSVDSLVTGPDIQQYAGVKSQHGFDQFIIVCSGGFTAPAIENAKSLNVDLVDIQGLYELSERDEPLAEVSESRENSGHSTLAGEGDEGEKACFSGETQTATESFTLDHRLVLIDYTHPNGSNLIVSLINIDTGSESYAINEIENQTGKMALYVDQGNYVLNVERGQRWEITVEQPKYSRRDIGSLPLEVEQIGQDIIGPIKFQDTSKLKIEAEGESNVIVSLLSVDGQTLDLLVNEIGPCEASTVLTHTGPAIVYVETSGKWRVTISDL